MQIGNNDNFWANWSNLEWLIAGIMTIGAAVTAFVWRLSVKVMMLEHMVKKNDEDTNERHRENMGQITGLRHEIHGLTARIDRWIGRRGPVD
jgi:hypothetical protein